MRPLWGEEPPEPVRNVVKAITHDGHHSLLLAEAASIPLVLIVLYEKPFAAVQLCRSGAPGALPPDSMTLGLFGYRAKTHRVLRPAEKPDALACVLR